MPDSGHEAGVDAFVRRDGVAGGEKGGDEGQVGQKTAAEEQAGFVAEIPGQGFFRLQQGNGTARDQTRRSGSRALVPAQGGQPPGKVRIPAQSEKIVRTEKIGSTLQIGRAHV